MATPPPIVPSDSDDSAPATDTESQVCLTNSANTHQLTNRKLLQAPSETDSLADVFQDINTWAGDPNTAADGLASNFSEDRTYVGSEVSKAFKSIMFDGDNDLLPNRVDNVIAWSSISTKALDLYYRYKFLVGYLEADKGTEKIADFIREIKADDETSPHWKISSKESEV